MGHQQEMEHQRKTYMLQEQIEKERNKSRQMEMEMDSIKRYYSYIFTDLGKLAQNKVAYLRL